MTAGVGKPPNPPPTGTDWVALRPLTYSTERNFRINSAAALLRCKWLLRSTLQGLCAVCKGGSVSSNLFHGLGLCLQAWLMSSDFP